MKRVYFAGSVDSYRKVLFRHHDVMSVKPGTVVTVHNGGMLQYGGPSKIDGRQVCPNGCLQITTHGCAGDCNLRGNHGCCSEAEDGDGGRSSAVARCLSQIDACDAVHAYINSADCYGTLIELGYASAKGKPIYLVYDRNLHYRVVQEMWFAGHLPVIAGMTHGGPTDIHASLLEFDPGSFMSSPTLETRARLESTFRTNPA